MYYQQPHSESIYNISYEDIKKRAEKIKLKESANFTGIMLIVSTAVFLILSYLTVFIIQLISETYMTTWIFDASNDSLLINTLTGFCNISAIGICGFIFTKKLTETGHKDTVSFDKVSAKKLIALCVIGFTVCNLSNLMTSLFLESAYSFGIDLSIDSGNYDSNSIIEIVVYIVSVAVVPAFSEELLFRGAVLSSLRKFGDSTAVFVSALFFGLFHGNFIQIPFAFIVGLVLSYTVIYTNSLLPAMLIHFLNNCFSVVCDILYTNTERWHVDEYLLNTAVYAFIVITVVISFLSLAAISRKDKEFLRLEQYNGCLGKKDATKTLLKSPGIIIAFLLLLCESVLAHISI